MPGRHESPISGVLRWLLVIALLIGVAGCGNDNPSPPSARDACGFKAPKFDGPSTRLTYRGSDNVVADIPDICARLKALKVPTSVDGSGRDRLIIRVPAAAVAGATFAARSGRVAFYDWEANVIGPDGVPAPTDSQVTGGAAAGRVGALDHYDAVVRASKRPPSIEADNGRKGSVFYAVDPAASKVYGSSGSLSRATARGLVPAGERARAKVLEVNPGTVILAGEQRPGVPDSANESYFVLKDDVALRGTDIEDPEQGFDEAGGGASEPIVTFDFSRAGATAFAKLTRELARRGSRGAGVGDGRSAADANQHFAIALDHRIASIPYIDFRANPNGVDGSTGSQIQGGFTIATARQLATVLSTGELEVPLELIGTQRSP